MNGEEYVNTISEEKNKGQKDFLGSSNSKKSGACYSWWKKYSYTQLSLSLQYDITTKKTSETFECIFQELFPPTPSSGLLSVPSKLTENYRWLKLKDSETVQVLYQPAPYKAPDPNKIKTILIRKA